MSNFSFRLAAIPVITLGVLFLSAEALGQTDRVSPIAAPCQDRDAPGRATLKRRLPISDEPAYEDNDTQKVTEKEKCKPDSEIESSTDANKITIRFEGLFDVAESDLLKYLREQQVQPPNDPKQESIYVAKASDRIKEFLVARGYRHPTIAARVERSDADARALIFVIHEGPRP